MKPDRIAKLRALAEHPDTPRHEAANARAEIERLRAKGAVEEAPPLSWLDVGRSANIEEFEARYREMMRRERPAHWGQERARTIREAAERRARGIFIPGEAGYYKWAGSLKVGDEVDVHWCHDAQLGHVERETITRVTATRYFTSDGRAFRRTGKHPGYLVGETGHTGRTYLVGVPQ
jgi:hypothetical protein